jgi:hypothetical protein
MYRAKSLTSLLVGVLVIATTASAAGCGGGDDSSAGETRPYDVVASTTVTVATPRLTKAKFVRRMNELCRGAWRKVIHNWDLYSGTQDPKLSEAKRFEEAVRLSLLAGIDFHIFDNFVLLGVPPGETKNIERIIGPFQEAVELGQKNRWRAHDTAEVAAQFRVFNQRASQYGLDDCLVTESHMKIQ